MNRTLAVEVRSPSGKLFSFNFRGDPKHMARWQAEGLVVHEVVGSIPVWAQQLGLTRPWFAVQAAWNWLRLV